MDTTNENKAAFEAASVAAEKRAEQQRFQKWWERLTTPGKKAVVRQHERAAAKAQFRAKPKTVTSGYQCPKCWSWFPTPEARRDCRLSHHKQEA